MRTKLFIVCAMLGGVASGCDDSNGIPGGGGDASVPDLAIPAVDAPFGLDSRPANPSCVAPARPPDTSTVKFVRAFPALSFSQPVLMLQAPGDASRWFVVEKGGTVKVFPNQDNVTAGMVTTYADITSRVSSAAGEAGLLGMAFHPKFTTDNNKKVYLSYTAYGPYPGHKFNPGDNPNVFLRSTVALYLDKGGTLETGANTEKLVFPPDDSGDANTQGPMDQPFSNHNGGNIAFGPDGYLYFGLGDGGDGGDPLANGQNLSVFFGKMLRVDVDNIPPGKRYGIPPTNPFVNGPRPEIYAYGLRNPWRWTFDRETGDLWCGDVGQNLWEEVDKIQLGGNYGWRLREGAHCYNPGTNCPTAGLIDPLAEYMHPATNNSRSITGGYVYHGTAIPALVGSYIYADEVMGTLYSLGFDAAQGKLVQKVLIDTMGGVYPTSFGQGPDGELYITGYNGNLYKLTAAGTPAPDTFPKLLSQTGCVKTDDPTQPADGLIPYEVNASLWSDGAGKRRWMALPDGKQIHINADGDWDLPIGTVLMKEFSLGSKRVETRLLMRHPDDVWAGYSYEWNDAGTEATLLPAGKTKVVGAQSWTFPSRGDCITCHTNVAGHSLGLETGQLNGNAVYASTLRRSNQLATLDHIGLFDQPLGKDPSMFEAYPKLDGPEPLENRARAYLHANCSICHRPNGTGQGPADFRYQTSLKMTGTCNADPQETNLGIMGAKILFPGSPDKSIITARMHALDVNRMPPLATAVVDPMGTQLIDSWISSLTTCP